MNEPPAVAGTLSFLIFSTFLQKFVMIIESLRDR